MVRQRAALYRKRGDTSNGMNRAELSAQIDRLTSRASGHAPGYCACANRSRRIWSISGASLYWPIQARSGKKRKNEGR